MPQIANRLPNLIEVARVPCPLCGAAAGTPCAWVYLNNNSRVRPYSHHAERWKAYRDLPQPPER